MSYYYGELTMVGFVIKCMHTNTWLGKLRSNTPFPHNVLYIGSFYVFSALLASDLEDLGLFSKDNLISIRISRVSLLIS